MASNRILLINEEIQKELSSLLRTVKDPRVQDVMISITRVETTPTCVIPRFTCPSSRRTRPMTP